MTFLRLLQLMTLRCSSWRLRRSVHPREGQSIARDRRQEVLIVKRTKGSHVVNETSNCNAGKDVVAHEWTHIQVKCLMVLQHAS